MMDNDFYARLEKRIPPYLLKGSIYFFEFDTNLVYAYLDGKIAEYPLRGGLAGYLWLCLYEKGYFTRADKLEDLIDGR
jgi:hypothetical protein